jgi:hypothetical protein
VSVATPIYPPRRSLFHPYDSAQNTAKVELDKSTSSGGQIWYQLINKWIDRISYSDSDNNAAMIYSDFGAMVIVYDLLSSPSLSVDSLVLLKTTSILVHEATHGFTPTHIECPGGTITCDADENGSYSIQILWLRNWFEVNRSVLSSEECALFISNVKELCSQINDDSLIEACDFSSSNECE